MLSRCCRPAPQNCSVRSSRRNLNSNCLTYTSSSRIVLVPKIVGFKRVPLRSEILKSGGSVPATKAAFTISVLRTCGHIYRLVVFSSSHAINLLSYDRLTAMRAMSKESIDVFPITQIILGWWESQCEGRCLHLFCVCERIACLDSPRIQFRW